MEKTRVLIDTNVLIKLFRGNKTVEKHLKSIGNGNIIVSDITIIEMLVGCTSVNKRKDFEEQLKAYGKAIVDKDIIEKTKTLIRRYAPINEKPIQIPDMIIASNAIWENIELLTYNKKDFEFIKELKFHKFSK